MHSLLVICNYNYSIFFERFVNKLCTNGVLRKIEQIYQNECIAIVDINYNNSAGARDCCKMSGIIV